MSYNTDHLRTAGKITVYTTFLGLVAFAFIFILNIGETQIKQADAQSNATTSVTVVNTPPAWTASTTEITESSTTTPTNAGQVVSWTAIGTDSNSEDYWLLICEDSSAPTATPNGAPACSTGVQWAVSASTTSGVAATAATTTTASTTPFDGEIFSWYGWVCDGNLTNPRCSTVSTQGTHATNSSPFEVNHRPNFSVFSDNSPADPGVLVTFSSTANDDDISGTNDTVQLIVCASSGFSTTTDTCVGDTLATSTLQASDPTATYTIVIPTQDGDFNAYGYVIDSHGFESGDVAHDTDSTLSVNNVAPTVGAATISLVQPVTTNMVLSVESDETTGFALSFTTSDDNSCDAIGGGGADEITGYDLSIYRNGSGNSSTTCAVTGPYDPNDCYPSSVAPAAWNLVCTASTTTCTGSTDVDMEWDCTFPLWYIADPTDGTATSTQYSTNDWRAQVQAVDDGLQGVSPATGTPSESSTGVEVTSFLAFALSTLSIPYGSLEPGQQTDPLIATTTILATGNVGLDKDVTGESMCESYTGATPCAPDATATIPASEQVFATTTTSYASATALSSTTAQEIEINVPKSTATSSQASADAYWGIRVPGTITYAGDYTGENTFTAIVGEQIDW